MEREKNVEVGKGGREEKIPREEKMGEKAGRRGGTWKAKERANETRQRKAKQKQQELLSACSEGKYICEEVCTVMEGTNYGGVQKSPSKEGAMGERCIAIGRQTSWGKENPEKQ